MPSQHPLEVNTGANPPLLFDYGGFPPATYNYKYEAPGSVEIAGKVLTVRVLVFRQNLTLEDTIRSHD
jgi:aromatic ring-opening dioxygenase catalytic subunit (LigB family)